MTGLRQGAGEEVREHERAEILEALRDAHGRVQKAAKILGVCRRRAYKYLHRFGLWEELEAIRQRYVQEDGARADLAARTLQALVPEGEPPPALSRKAASRAPVWWETRRKR